MGCKRKEFRSFDTGSWNMITELLSSPVCKETVEEALAGWAARTASGAEAVKNCPFISALLAELKRI